MMEKTHTLQAVRQFKTLKKPQRLSDEVSRQISEKITSGEIPLGSKLPSESVLAQEFGVSRSAIREAVAKLRQDGLVRSHQGLGLFVADDLMARAFQIDSDSLKTVEDLRDLMELRIEMDVGGAGMAARRRTHGQLAKMRAILQRMREAMDRQEDYTSLEQDFHRITAEATQNIHFRDFVQFLA
jgi:DNA-binding FadR family transcriptional regulator